MRRRDALILKLAGGLAWLTDRLACLGAAPTAITQDILVVRLDAIGDFLLWSDAACRLALHYRGDGRRVVLLANAAWAELAETLGVFDAVWPLERHRFLFDVGYRYATLRKIRKAGFTLAIQPTFSREPLFGDAVMRIAGWRQRIGSVGDLSNMTRSERMRADRGYSALLPAAPQALSEIERNVEFLAGLGIHAEPRIGRLPLRLCAAAGTGGGDYFVLFPGASWDAKRWPPEPFAALA
jgi:ADP-heptose:LPS heptosyltransferase